MVDTSVNNHGRHKLRALCGLSDQLLVPLLFLVHLVIRQRRFPTHVHRRLLVDNAIDKTMFCSFISCRSLIGVGSDKPNKDHR